MASGTISKIKGVDESSNIASGDLNDVTDSGFYFCSGSMNQISNMPTNYPLLIVLNAGIRVQICFTKTLCYWRAFSGSPASWGSWNQVQVVS